jgi:hypothetical protein
LREAQPAWKMKRILRPEGLEGNTASVLKENEDDIKIRRTGGKHNQCAKGQ